MTESLGDMLPKKGKPEDIKTLHYLRDFYHVRIFDDVKPMYFFNSRSKRDDTPDPDIKTPFF
jgi:hypothetical protein